MESFAGLVQIFLFSALPDYFVEVGATIFWALILFCKMNYLVTRNHNYRMRALSEAVYMYYQAIDMLMEDSWYCCEMKKGGRV